MPMNLMPNDLKEHLLKKSPTQPLVKFCGMTRAADVDYAIQLGVDAIGIILLPNTPRSVSIETALEFRSMLPKHVALVPVVRDMPTQALQALCERLKPDFIQFHGNETQLECESISVPYFKAISVTSEQDVVDAIAQYQSAQGFIFDAKTPQGSGGQGVAFDWSLFPDHKPIQERRIFGLAGGLNIQTIDAALKHQPDLVDISSGIECLENPVKGIKSFEQMKGIMQKIQNNSSSL